MIIFGEILWTLCEVTTGLLVLAFLYVAMFPESRKDEDE